MERFADVRSLTNYITDEVINALGLTPEGWTRRTLGPFFRYPAQRFARVAALFDQYVAQFGFGEAARRVLPNFSEGFTARGSEHIPSGGPLLITSNHPGTCDSLVIAANIPRPDLKIVATGVPFVRSLPCAAEHLIYCPRPEEGAARANVVRAAIRHLQEGGAVLIFPTGSIDPDPVLQDGAGEALNRWSPSLELILRYVPQAKVLVTIVSGVLSDRWLNSPFTRLAKEAWEQRRVAEFLQVIQQMVLPHSVPVFPHVTFGDPLSVEELTQEGRKLLDGIITQARELLATHLALEQSPAKISLS